MYGFIFLNFFYKNSQITYNQPIKKIKIYFNSYEICVFLSMAKKILITGGTGLIGQQLTRILNNKGYEVAILSRNPSEKNEYKWDIPNEYIDEEALKNTTHIIHLAGAGIADKNWSDDRKKILIDSRVNTANLLFSKIAALNIPVKKFISASGIGYYGATTNETIYTEKDTPGNDFVAKICVAWENAAQQFKQLGITTTVLRTGVVLSKTGGALEKMNTPIALSAIGNGKQIVSWIHINDICNLYVKAVEEDTFSGIYNAVAPDFVTNKEFTKTLGKATKKPILPINAPSFVLKLIFGEMAAIILEGSRISFAKTAKEYKFTQPNLLEALKSLDL